ncbi:hypothetical protein [Actinotalea sp. Marseille-Q4924]|uniref:hypothetical protein n=1 Tax=Actinotalea sp. Marseille-Q4924 TaxID=2866571 RepID=UPI001CE45186|nr:hypothetical protein [Actinotalea sp. Marseille-Q4924]
MSSAGRARLRVAERLALPLTTGTAVLVVCLVMRMAPGDAAAAAVGTVGITLALRMLDKGDEHAFPPGSTRDTEGSRRDVAHLTWSFVGRDGRVSEAAVRRLRADARRRLARAGVTVPPGVLGSPPDEAAHADATATQAVADARALLGEPAWTVLTDTGGWLPTLAEVEQCVEAIERLAPAGRVPPGTTSPDGRTTT